MTPANVLQKFISLFGMLLGFGDDVLTVITGSDSVRDKYEAIKSLGAMWPAEVDRILSVETSRKFLVEDLLPSGCIAFTGGDSGIGKSPLLMMLALCVASGKPFLGMPIGQSGPVLYFDLENSLADSQLMRNALCKFLGLDEPPRHFYLMTEPPDKAKLHEVVSKTRAVLTIFDSLRSYNPDAAKDNTTAGLWINSLRNLIKELKCSFVFNHHLRKADRKFAPAPLEEDTRVTEWCLELEGARALVNQTDVRIALENTHDGLKMKWNRRVHGDSSLYLLERCFDKDGEPIGYVAQTGILLLKADQQLAYEALPQKFPFKDAMAALKKTANPTAIFLKRCCSIGLLQKLPDSAGYVKIPPK